MKSWLQSKMLNDSRNPVLFCKRNGDCELNTESRRHCKKCRYQRCLLAGMRPEAVLDTQQKKIHFRKYYSKQERLSKVKKKKSMNKEEAKLSRSRNDAKHRPSQQPRHKIVKIEQRTPERRDFDADGTFFNNLYQSADICRKENNPVGFNSWENSCPSSFSNPAYQHCSYDFSYGNMTRPLPPEEYGQSSVQLPDLDDIHTEALFFWNSMDFN
jgi:hypothetical protein